MNETERKRSGSDTDREGKRFITFTGSDGRTAGRTRLSSGTGTNKHYNLRRPDGPVCPDCGEKWEPFCPTKNCKARRETKYVIQGERGRRDVATRQYGHRKGNVLEAR